MYASVRKINNIRSKKNTGSFPSKKMKSNIEYESLLERDYFYWLEYDRQVKRYLSQPITIEYKDTNKKKRRYTPDCYFETVDGKKYLVEVKPRQKLDKILSDESQRIKYDAAYTYCINNNMKLIIVTDKEINKGNILKNIKYIHGFSNISVPDDFAKMVVSYIDVNTPLSIQRIMERDKCFDMDKVYQYVMNMIYYGKLFINMDNLLADSREKTLVYLQEGQVV
jgi:hypothetical protein